MTTVKEIEEAIAQLPMDEFWQLTDRLLARRNAEWDRQIAEDAASGRLDFLYDEVEAERKAGVLRDWPEPPA